MTSNKRLNYASNRGRSDLTGRLPQLLLPLPPLLLLLALLSVQLSQGQRVVGQQGRISQYVVPDQFAGGRSRSSGSSSRQLGSPQGPMQAFGPPVAIPLPEAQRQPAGNNMGFGLPNDYVEKTIYPYDSFDHEQYGNGSTPMASNVIEHKRFVESASTRCMSSTIMEDPMAVEPSLVLVRPSGETRLQATAHPSRIMAAGYEPNKPTVILIHGFTQSYPNTTWLRLTRGLFERNQRLPNFNLFIMDWSPASSGSYSQAAAMTSGMGSFLANFLMKLYEDLGSDRLKIHLVGHSLGAHVAGFAGKRIRPRIGRITGLDPAGPCFGKILSNSPTDRLSPDDAIEVDVYHYDDDFLGLPGQHGQFDVLVNGGSKQPGCQGNTNAMFGAVVTMVFRLNRALSESHTRSTEVASALLSPPRNYCQLVAYECRDYAAFTQGECAKCDNYNGQCFLMSLNYQFANRQDPETMMFTSKQPQPQRLPSSQNALQQQQPPLRTSFPGKRMYIQTSDKDNYCLQHYQILVKFEPSPELAQQAKRQKWRLHLDVLDDLNRRLNFTAQNQMAPNVFSFLLLSDGPPTRIRSAELQVRTSSGAPVPLVGVSSSSSSSSGGGRQPAKNRSTNSYQVFAIEVQFMSDINPEGRRLLSSRLCPMEASNMIAESAASSSEWLHFEECLS